MMISGNRLGTCFLSGGGFFALFFLLSFVSQHASYDIGQTYNYRYVTSLTLNEADKTLSKDLTYQVTADVAATTVWENPENALETLLLLQVKQAKLLVLPKNGNPDELKSHASRLDHYEDEAIVLRLNDGTISELFAQDAESKFLNFKAGIASLFQFKIENKDKVTEMDTSGECSVSYKVTGNTIQKIKHWCNSSLTRDSFKNFKQVLNADIQSNILTTYTLTKDHAIASAVTTETHSVLVNLLKDNGVVVSSQQSLKLDNREDGNEKVIKGSNVKEAISRLQEVIGSTLSTSKFYLGNTNKPKLCKKFPELIRERQAHFKAANLAKITTAANFLDVIKRSRNCSKDVLVKVLKSNKNKAILPQLLDVVAASRTIASFESALEILNFDSESLNLPERFLTSLSVIPHPKADVLQKLIDLVKRERQSEKLQETLTSTLGTLLQKYSLAYGKDDAADQATAALIKNLRACQTDSCKYTYLRALRNAALRSVLSEVLDVSKECGKCILEVLRMIQNFKASEIDKEVKVLVEQLFYRLTSKRDSTSRILAAEILLDNEPSVNLIEDIMLSMAREDSVEVNTYILSKIKVNMQRDQQFRNKVGQVLANSSVGIYNVLAQNGMSTTFTNPFFDESSFNATYGLNMEMITGGLLKRSTFSADLNLDDLYLTALSFGLYADGLGSLAGEESSSNDGEEQVMTAGIELSILGSPIRPYTLFTGQNDLMSLVWSGAGSETTPILQGNFLLHDHQRELPLQNGFILDASVMGVLSYDLSGSVEVSLWNRNSHSVVSNRGAVVIQNLIRLNSDFINSQASVTTTLEGSLDFVTDFEFYEAPFKMCTQMKQAPISLRRTVNKLERIPDSKHRLRRTRKGAMAVPGRSFALNRKNSFFCSIMVKK